MTTEHPIIPPPELVQQWWDVCTDSFPEPGEDEDWIAIDDFRNNLLAAQAARWGADKELEACLQLLEVNGCPRKFIDLLTDRRPKPPSLKEQALKELAWVDEHLKGKAPLSNHCDAIHAIRRALEQLPND